MRVFGLGKNTKTSAARRADATLVNEADAMHVVQDLSRTEEMPIVREAVLTQVTQVPQVVESTTLGLTGGAGEDGEDGDSDVFVCRSRANGANGSPEDSSPEISPDRAAAEAVTLFVYGWHNVEPGPLSWAFPSLRAALDAVKTMRNAIEWSIVSGNEWASIDAARESGAVLIEQNA